MAKHTKKISPQLVGILSRLQMARGPMAWVARITDGQLDRKVYVLLNEALEALGGKWHKGVKGHIFAEDPTEAIEELILTGEYKTKFAGDFFQTPISIAQRMAEWAVRSGDRVLEPSAGAGRLVRAAFSAGASAVVCVELDENAPRACGVSCQMPMSPWSARISSRSAPSRLARTSTRS